jgi:hypothetical protein
MRSKALERKQKTEPKAQEPQVTVYVMETETITYERIVEIWTEEEQPNK